MKMEINNDSSGLETELRLGLPGGGEGGKKRVFSEVFEGGGEWKKKKKKNQVVGWPPVRGFRQKNMSLSYVKVSMDGAPFLRKVDLSAHKGYNGLLTALEQLFGCFGIGKALNEGSDSCEYVPIYEDKDGDWMLLGDVPWEMFFESCKRLRITKNSADETLNAKDLIKGLSEEE